jgi:RNA polymerase sigma factor (sigma-70 family)
MPDNDKHLMLLLDGTRRGERNAQRKLYEHFYGYGLSICLRYAQQRAEAVEILNDAFLKVFTKIDRYDNSLPFKPWLRRILIHTAIDHLRAGIRPIHVDLNAAPPLYADEGPMPMLSPAEDALPYIQQLPPGYRMVFNLYVMEEYDHREIAEMLGISEATSRSNLARAKEKLREMLQQKKGKDTKQTASKHHRTAI